MSGSADIGIVGLGVMGLALAENFHSRGHTVAGYNRSPAAVSELLTVTGGERVVGCGSLAELVGALARPRKIMLMVPAGKVVDAVLDELVPLLEAGDIVVDGGNSHFADTERRLERAAQADWRFVGMGVSGGEEGALHRPGDDAGRRRRRRGRRIEPLHGRKRRRGEPTPARAWTGAATAAPATSSRWSTTASSTATCSSSPRCYDLLRHHMGLTPPQVRDVFARWNAGPLESFLIEITAGIVAAKDPEGRGPLLDQVLDRAGQKGTGRWTSITATEAGVPLSTITAAVDARALSSMKALRQQAAGAYADLSAAPLTGVTVDDLEAALYAAKILSYTQGFSLLRQASAARGYETDLARVSRIWKAGCIIRAAFLDEVYAAYSADPDLELLVLAPGFVEKLQPRLASWRRVVASATLAGAPVPALSASLAWFDTITRARGSANVIQAQRDWFGAHTYRRVDDPDTPVHSDWASLEQLSE